jgi:glycosyltransferase involved in cell wall biosynthesis
VASELIAFDATPLEAWSSGVARYTEQLLSALVARGDGRSYALLAGRRLSGRLPPGALEPAGPFLPNRTVWMQLVAPLALARLRPALAHFTNSLAPLAAPCPYVVTLHDMSLFLHPHTQPAKSLVLVRPLLPAIARRAAAIITVSHSARRDLLAVLRVPPAKVHVVYEAAAPAYHALDDGADLARVRARYGLHTPFALYVGTLEPRKNLETLVRAFAQVQRGRPEQLVLAGRLGWKYHELLRLIEALGAGDAVRLLGYVPDDDLPALYNLACVLVYPSLYEGFGLPVVEAMACGTPVITSDRTSLAELGAGAALLVDPLDVEMLAARLRLVLDDADLRAELRAAGFRRAAEFSWARAAAETVAVYEGVKG